jgi:DNA-directed RNA polymerase I subunit RPA43
MEATEQVEEEEEIKAQAEDEVQAEVAEEVQAEGMEALSTVLPLGRVKNIMRVDRDINKVTVEVSLLIVVATELFLGSLAAGAHTAITQHGRRSVRAMDIRAAAHAHRHTADFLLNCLPAAEEAPRLSSTDAAAAWDPPHRRILL